MRRADGRLWVRGVGCACRLASLWWIPRLVRRGCTVIMCTIGSWVRRGHLLTAMAERPFYFFKIPASVGCPDLLG